MKFITFATLGPPNLLGREGIEGDKIAGSESDDEGDSVTLTGALQSHWRRRQWGIQTIAKSRLTAASRQSQAFEILH